MFEQFSKELDSIKSQYEIRKMCPLPTHIPKYGGAAL